MATMDDEDVFIDTGRRPSPVRRVSYFIVALVAALLPVYLYVGILGMDISEAQITIVSGSIVGAALLSLAYHNIYFSKRVQVTKDNAAPTKSMFRKKSDDYVNAYASYESQCSIAALTWSFFYNNILFFALVVFFGVYVLRAKVSFLSSSLLHRSF